MTLAQFEGVELQPGFPEHVANLSLGGEYRRVLRAAEPALEVLAGMPDSEELAT